MRRREFVGGLLILSVPDPIRAQARPRITILHSGYPNRTPINLLFDALQRLGYVDGNTAAIEVLGAEGNSERLKALVAYLKAQKPDVIIAITSPAVLALKQAQITAPVAFAFLPDPVGLGIVKSLAQPGGNFTGVTYSQVLLGGKWLDLLIDAVPPARRIAVLWSGGFAENPLMVQGISQSASIRGMEVFTREVQRLEDLAAAFAEARQAGAQAVIFITDNLMFGHRKEVAEFALANHLPSLHSFPPEVQDGGLMSYGPSLGENYERAAAFADRILKGTPPGELPVEQPTKFELVLNLKTAKTFGLTIPPSLLARADEVIE